MLAIFRDSYVHFGPEVIGLIVRTQKKLYDDVIHKGTKMVKYLLYFVLFCAAIGYTGVLAIEEILREEDPVISQLSLLREELGHKPLREDRRLTCAARNHAYDMFVRSMCTHTNRLGHGPKLMARSCDYPWTQGELIVVCPPFERDLLPDLLLTFYRDEFLKYNFAGHHEFDGFHAIFLAE